MATYIGIKGVPIQTIAGDPANPIAGQVWYNTTANTLKGYGMQGTGAWATGNNINTARKSPGSGGLVSTAWIAGGVKGPLAKDETETYDGTSWSETADLTTGRGYSSGAGSNTAALSFGGVTSPLTNQVDNTETWNATSWTEVANLNTARDHMTSQGTSTAALTAGGTTTPPSVQFGETEEWDGTSWSELADLTTARHNCASSTQGTPSAMIVSGGAPGPFYFLCETWNGTSWTETSNVNSAKVQAGGSGIETFALTWGGINPPWYTCEEWNGTSWTEVGDTAIVCYGTGHAGTATEAWQCAGLNMPGADVTTTEEWATPNATKTFTSS